MADKFLGNESARTPSTIVTFEGTTENELMEEGVMLEYLGSFMKVVVKGRVQMFDLSSYQYCALKKQDAGRISLVYKTNSGSEGSLPIT